MPTENFAPFTPGDNIKEFAVRLAASGLLPGTWFNPTLPKREDLTPAKAPMTLEIVSHCWQYSQFQMYQLSSLVNHAPTKLKVILTVMYSEEDLDTVRLLDFFQTQRVPNVRWNFLSMPKEQLFRRSIGRNIAARQTEADWIWFTDCDVAFYDGALDTLAQQLVGCQEYLVYPTQMLATELLPDTDPIIAATMANPHVVQADLSRFSVRSFSRATGPIQIAHGDVARACGYCGNISVYQKTMQRWAKCYDDRAFRWQLGTTGKPIEIPNVLFIRHAEKGRYREKSQFSTLRKSIRQVKSALFGR